MRTRSTVEHEGTTASAADEEQLPSIAGDRQDQPIWALGSRIAAHQVEAARKAYLRYAEAGESTLSALDSTASRASRQFCAAASAAQEALLLLRAKMPAAAQDASGHVHASVERGFSTLKAKAASGRADFRAIALRGQVAADTNVRAYLDCLGDLTKASSLQNLVLAQSSFFWDQWRRSLQQTLDLQQRTAGALRKITSASAA